ncbi:MAG: isoprenylcysteine carboxylmethyltransferase family protein [Ghiorsea sp.]
MTENKNIELTAYEGFFYHNRPRITGLAALIVIVLAQPSVTSVLWGSLLVILGEAGRTWALGYIDKDAALATGGPYAFTRNPLYVFNLTMCLGFCVMGNQLYPALAALLIFFWNYIVIIDIEARRMISMFGDDYAEWSKHVPLFIPRLSPWKDCTKKPYSAALMKGHKEPKHWLGTVVGLSIFYAIYVVQSLNLFA